MKQLLAKLWFRSALLVALCLGILCLLIAAGLAVWVNTYSQAPQVTWTTVYNEAPDYLLTEDPLYAGAPYAQRLNALQLRLVTPDGKADWMQYKDGFAVSDDEAMRFVAFKVTTQTPGVDIHISVGQWPHYAEDTMYHSADYKASVLGDISYTLCQNRFYLTASACVDGIYYTFQAERIPEREEQIKADLKTVLECFTTYEAGVPGLQRIKPGGKPVYFAYWEYTAQQARKDDVFGKYFPSEDPAGFTKFSGMRLHGLYLRNQMNGDWSAGKGERLYWYVVKDPDDVLRWNGPERAETTNDEPVLEALTMTKSDLKALLGDDENKQSLKLCVRYGDVIVGIEWDSVSGGVDIDWLYKQLKGILWRW